MDPVHDLNDMFFFAQVVEHGSYTGAAEALGMQTSKLSRRISGLERQLGVRLLNRTTRRISMTEAGRTFYRHCAALVAEAQAAREAIDQARATPQGLVRISCPLPLLQGGVATILSRYLSDNPRVRIALMATNHPVDLVEGGLDIALRVRMPPLEDTELAVRKLATSEGVLVASPELFGRYARPSTLEDMRALPTLGMPGAGDKHVWRLPGPDGELISFAHTPRLSTDDLDTLRRAALLGVGIALLPTRIVQADVDRGTLERILPDLSSPRGVVHAVFASTRGLSPAVRGLLDALVKGFDDRVTGG